MAGKYIKLTTGEDVVADIKDENGVLSIKNPVRFMMTKEGLGMLPFLPLAKEAGLNDKWIQLDSKYVMLVLDLEDEIYNHYNSAVGSGIVLPSAEQTMRLVVPEE